MPVPFHQPEDAQHVDSFFIEICSLRRIINQFANGPFSPSQEKQFEVSRILQPYLKLAPLLFIQKRLDFVIAEFPGLSH